MDLTIPQESTDLARSARSLFQASGLAVARRAHDDAAAAVDQALGLLRTLGMEDLTEISTQADQAYAAALLAEEAGRAALPVPTAALLTNQVITVGGPVHAVRDIQDKDLLVDFGGIANTHIVDMAGRVAGVRARETRVPPKMVAPHAVLVDVDGPLADTSASKAWAWHEVFSAFSTAGALAHVLDLGKRHLNERFQFGKPLRARQSLEFRYVDATVSLRGFRELALFTVWRLLTDDTDGLGAALTLRLAHLESVRDVMRHIHQIHGAIGFCFEHDLAVISQHVQFRRYQPVSLSRTRVLLGERLDDIPMIYTPADLV